MSIAKKIIYIIAIIILAFLLLAVWYNSSYSMKVVESYEVNDHIQDTRMLIATQGSEFKNDIVQEIIDEFDNQEIYIKVVDVGSLGEVNEHEWDAIVIMHTWEYWKPQKDAAAFVNRIESLDHVVVLTTSGNSEAKMEDIDAITSASILTETPSVSEEISSQLKMILRYDVE